jgi:hypothetical protein
MEFNRMENAMEPSVYGRHGSKRNSYDDKTALKKSFAEELGDTLFKALGRLGLDFSKKSQT